MSQITDLLSGVISTLNLALWPDKEHIASRVPGLKASWRPTVKLSDFYSYLARALPVTSRNLFLESDCFKLFMRDYKNLDLNWFPVIKMNFDLVEFKDGIYSFEGGGVIQNNCDFYETPVTCRPNDEFEDLRWPKRTSCSLTN